MNKTLEDLKNCDNTIELFSLNGQILDGKVVDIYDADTCKIVFFINNNFVKFNCRLSGIDTPELRPKKININYEKEKKLGFMARNRLIQLCSNEGCCNINSSLSKKDKISLLRENKNIMKVKCGKFDKYGRLLVELFNNNNSLNSLLVSEKYALEYDGGTKKKDFNFDYFSL